MTRLGLLLMLALVPVALRADDIQVCKDAQGNITYQDDPCPEPEPPPKAKRVPKPKAKAQAKPQPQAKPQAMVLVPTPAPAKQPPRRDMPATTMGTFPTRVDGKGAAPSFVSPEQTWRTLLGAIASGDRAGALACFSAAGLKGFGPEARAFSVDTLRQALGDFSKIEPEGEVGPFWSIRGLRDGRPPKWIFFERTGPREWKIAAL